MKSIILDKKILYKKNIIVGGGYGVLFKDLVVVFS